MSESEAEPSRTRAAKRLKMTSPPNQSNPASDAHIDASTIDVSTIDVSRPSSLPNMSADDSTTQCAPESDGELKEGARSGDPGNLSTESEDNAESNADIVSAINGVGTNTSGLRTGGHDTTRWPTRRVPVEIFDMIIEHLSRKDIQSMRLVNHEFDAKLAGSYFKSVVVPFRPEFEALYGSLNVNPGPKSGQQKLSLVLKAKKSDAKTSLKEEYPDQTNAANDDISLLSDGYRVFEQFGSSCMRKFALALDLNEKDLAFPPLKVNQEIVMAPWGLYRWPIMKYQRYHQLEGLEQMADETGYMKKAFAFLDKVTDIGISCDAGLGWLQGPDTNSFCANTKPAVFRPLRHWDAEDKDTKATEQEDNASLSLTILKQMALNAGYNSNEWPTVILRLLEDEGRAVKWREHTSADGKIIHERVPTFQLDDDTKKEDIIRHIEDLIDGESTDAHFPNARGLGLVPNNLTSAQAEMLLELEWAHRALMQSYRTAILDNKLSFRGLTQLTIARCPSCHVSIWCDRSFWASMTAIKTFHLGVVPDWREITKDSSGSVTQRRVSPVDAAKEVFTLLQGYVGSAKHIEHISFEWVSGGEFAVGKSQRDRYILPAPVLINPDKMVDMMSFTCHDIVSLPHVSKLSLKNCWFSPHVFYNFTKSLFRDNVSELILESVSLTGPPSLSAAPSIYSSTTQKPTHWPWPLCNGAEPGKWFALQLPPNLANGGPVFVANGNVPLTHAAVLQAFNTMGNFAMGAANAVQQVGNQGAIPINHATAAEHAFTTPQHDNRWRAWSWPYILASLGALPEYFDEGSSVNGMLDYHAIKSTPKPLSFDFQEIFNGRPTRDSPRAIRLKSCGYALIEHMNIDNWKIIPDHALYVDHDISLPARLKELDGQMLISTHGLFGKVLHYLPPDEEQILRNTFGAWFGWDQMYDLAVIRAAGADGVPEPGKARFHGNLSTHPRRGNISTSSKGKQIARP